MHTNCKKIFSKFAAPLFKEGQRVLEVGPDWNPSSFRTLLPFEKINWETLDIHDAPYLTYPSSGLYSFPIKDDTFDIVLSGNVIEHVQKIWKWMPELARVAKPGGYVITIVPASWPYHEAPVDCWRMYPEGIKALCEESGLIVETVWCGSLELPNIKRAIPGRAPEWQPAPLRMAFRFLSLFGFPVEKSFDTICIARKPNK